MGATHVLTMETERATPHREGHEPPQRRTRPDGVTG